MTSDEADRKSLAKEKNRKAAAKCRAKKAQSVEQIKENHEHLKKKNQDLVNQVSQLKEEKVDVLSHLVEVLSQCTCPQVQPMRQEVVNKYGPEAVRQAHGFRQSHAFPSPPEDDSQEFPEHLSSLTGDQSRFVNTIQFVPLETSTVYANQFPTAGPVHTQSISEGLQQSSLDAYQFDEMLHSSPGRAGFDFSSNGHGSFFMQNDASGEERTS